MRKLSYLPVFIFFLFYGLQCNGQTACPVSLTPEALASITNQIELDNARVITLPEGQIIYVNDVQKTSSPDINPIEVRPGPIVYPGAVVTQPNYESLRKENEKLKEHINVLNVIIIEQDKLIEELKRIINSKEQSNAQ